MGITKGKWFYKMSAAGDYVIISDPSEEGELIGHINRHFNARLIAQSPRMAKLLKIISDEAPWKIDPEWQKMAREILTDISTGGGN